MQTVPRVPGPGDSVPVSTQNDGLRALLLAPTPRCDVSDWKFCCMSVEMTICISLRFFTNMITNSACILNILLDYKVENSAGRVWTVIKRPADHMYVRSYPSRAHSTVAAETQR